MFKKNPKVVLSFFTLFLSGVVGAHLALAAAPVYPMISEVEGRAWIIGKDGKKEIAKVKTVLREKAVLQADANSSMKVVLDEARSFKVLSGAEVSLPAISWDAGEAPVLFLRNGEIFWNQDAEKKMNYKTALRSDLFEFIAPNAKFIIGIDPAKAVANLKMLEGRLVFSAMNAEESVMLEKGQQVSFLGVLEEGEIAYDVLLQGKRIPKGHLSSISAFDMTEINKKEEEKKKLAAQKVALLKKKKEASIKLKKEGYICSSPAGKFNQCAWVCENNPRLEKKRCATNLKNVQCIRRRCNANGEWADSTPLESEGAGGRCRPQPIVAPCDY